MPIIQDIVNQLFPSSHNIYEVLIVHKAKGKPQKATVSLSLKTRKRLKVAPGYCVRIKGDSDHIARNFIVTKFQRGDPLINRDDVIRMGEKARKRIGVQPGDKVQVQHLHYSTWYHGTKAPDPLVLVREGWIVGSGAAYGPGIYLTSDSTIARSYVLTAMITVNVAWGLDINNVFNDGSLRNDFITFCREFGTDPQTHLQQYQNTKIDPVVFKWARFGGHYLPGGTNIRVFPGPIGSGFKPNLIRITSVVTPDGNILYNRARAPHEIS